MNLVELLTARALISLSISLLTGCLRLPEWLRLTAALVLCGALYRFLLGQVRSRREKADGGPR